MVCQHIIMVCQHISPEVTVKGVYPVQWNVGVSVQNLKALTVKMETVTLIGEVRQNVTCFLY
jgi:hypothetical protein